MTIKEWLKTLTKEEQESVCKEVINRFVENSVSILSAYDKYEDWLSAEYAIAPTASEMFYKLGYEILPEYCYTGWITYGKKNGNRVYIHSSGVTQYRTGESMIFTNYDIENINKCVDKVRAENWGINK